MYIRYCNGILCTAQDAIKDQKSITGHNTAMKSKQLHLYLITKDASSEKKSIIVYTYDTRCRHWKRVSIHRMQEVEKSITVHNKLGRKSIIIL